MASLPATYQYKDVNFGGGALLDIGVHPLMWSNLVLAGKVGVKASDPEVSFTMVFIGGVDYEDIIIMKYPETNRVGVLTAILRARGREKFLRVESAVVPLGETTRMMRVMDAVRKAGGVVYPQERS